jgi:hypothetical protein
MEIKGKTSYSIIYIYIYTYITDRFVGFSSTLMHILVIHKMMYTFSKIVIILLVYLIIYPWITGRLMKNTNLISILFFLIVLDAFRNNAEECCEVGRIQAETTKLCSMTLESLLIENTKNLSANCRFLTHICCLSNLRSYFCEEGLNTALRLLPCNETKLQSKDSYQVFFR